MRTRRNSPVRRKPTRLQRSTAKRRLRGEPLEGRLMLAQTTGLFFNNPGTSDGYVLFSPNTSKSTYLIDKSGTTVHQWTSNYLPGLISYLLPDGSLLRDSAPHGQGGNGSIVAAGAGGLLERFDWNGNKTWEFSYDTSTHLAHHDFKVMPNGNILLIAWELKSEAEATAAGRDPGLPGPGHLYPDSIVEVQPDYLNGGGTVVWQWQVWDHLVQEFDATKANYYGPTGVEDHPELINLNYVSTFDEGGGAGEDWTHANGIDYNAELDQIVLSVREFSEVWIIDHSTTTAEAAGHSGGNSGKGGDLLYRWGNPQTYDRGTDADRVFYYQHNPSWIPSGWPGAGDIMVFNNGFGQPGQDLSGYTQFTPPVDALGHYTITAGQPYGPAAPTIHYTGLADDFSPIISGAQRLANGNTFLTYGVMGRFIEVTPAGDLVWKYVNPYTGGGTLGPETPIPNLGIPDPVLGSLLVNFTFHAVHYPRNYVTQLPAEVTGRKLFYKGSSQWNVSNANLPGFSDDNAIADDKTAYLPTGAVTTLESVSSYTRGINGIMIDLAGAHGPITAADFAFKVGNNNSPELWGAAPPPSAITVRAGAGANGSDRIEIIWPDAAILNTWLEVTVKGNDALGDSNTNTNLSASDVFYFGSAPGDSGIDDASGFMVSTNDEVAARADPHGPGNRAAKTNVHDYNRDGLVNGIDQAAVRKFATDVVTQLNFLNLVVVVLAAAQTEGAAVDSPNSAANGDALPSAVAFGLVATATSRDEAVLGGDSLEPADEETLSLLATAIARGRRLR